MPKSDHKKLKLIISFDYQTLCPEFQKSPEHSAVISHLLHVHMYNGLRPLVDILSEVFFYQNIALLFSNESSELKNQVPNFTRPPFVSDYKSNQLRFLSVAFLK